MASAAPDGTEFHGDAAAGARVPLAMRVFLDVSVMRFQCLHILEGTLMTISQ